MKITGKVVTNTPNKRGCVFVAVQDSFSQDKTMFVSDTNNTLFCGQELPLGSNVTITALEEKAFTHGNTKYYRPLKVVISNTKASEEHSEALSKSTDTNTKEETKAKEKVSKGQDKAPKVHTLQRKVYGRVSKLSFKDKTAKITILDNHTETGEVLEVVFLRIPRDFEDGMRLSCNLECAETEGVGTGNTGSTVNTVKTTHAVYEDERKGLEQKMVKIIYGNARNVAAKAVGVKDVDKFNKLAMDIYTKGKVKREELKKEFSDMDDFDLGAKWGDAMKQAGNEYKTSAKIIELAEVLFRGHVEVEKGLV